MRPSARPALGPVEMNLWEIQSGTVVLQKILIHSLVPHTHKKVHIQQLKTNTMTSKLHLTSTCNSKRSPTNYADPCIRDINATEACSLGLLDSLCPNNT